MSNFDHVRIGDAIGFVDGPGVFPTDNIGVVTGFGEDRFYKYAKVIRPNGSEDKVVSFTTVGIGIYHLPTYLTKTKV